MKILSLAAALSICVMGGAAARGDDAAARAAVSKGLAIVAKAARSYPTHRKCFACHHQTLPLAAWVEAKRLGLDVDAKLGEEILAFTGRSFRERIDDLRNGEGIGGRGLTVGYGLWTLRLAKAPADELTAAMAQFLLKTQEADGHWGLQAVRPPAEESLVMCTVLAAWGLSYAGEADRALASAAISKARGWLASAKHEHHEDYVARLLGLAMLEGTAEEVKAARRVLLDAQRADGGWAQRPEDASDAYATGTTLYVLEESLSTHPLAAEEEASLAKALERSAAWLVSAQEPDGSWHVVTRAKPVQVFFDNGDPHGKDQFISTSATGWAIAALARRLSRQSKPSPRGE